MEHVNDASIQMLAATLSSNGTFPSKRDESCADAFCISNQQMSSSFVLSDSSLLQTECGFRNYGTLTSTDVQNDGNLRYEATRESARRGIGCCIKRRTSSRNTTANKRIVSRACATRRERNRMALVNAAFDELRRVVPKPNLTDQHRLSKIATLRMATKYIVALTNILDCAADRTRPDGGHLGQ